MIKKAKSYIYDIGTVMIGAVLFGAAVNMFIIPGNVILGGATGIATVIGEYTDIPTGLMIAAVNLPLLIINARFYGLGFVAKTAIGVLAVSGATDALVFLPVTLSDPLLCALLGGVSIGAGTGILFSRGYTTGGTDLIAWAVRKKNPRISAGRIIMICDLFIILVLTVISHTPTGIIYSFISIYSGAVVTDLISSGAERAKSAFIVSAHHIDIANAISDKLERGVTVFYGHGHYTGAEQHILVCVIKKNEIFALKRIIEETDRSAFVFFCDTSEVIGSGFEKV